MAKISGIGQRLYVQGFDLSGDTGQINNVGSPVNLLDVTPISAAAMERIMGRRDGLISFTAFFNDAADGEHVALKGLPTSDVLALYLMSATRGDACAAISAKQENYDGSRGADGSLTIAVNLPASAGIPLERGIILVAKTTSHTGETDETGDNFGSQTTVGAVGFLQHFEDTSPSGVIEYDIEDSSDSTDGDDGNWSNLIAFSNVSTPWAGIAERVAVNGNVEKWVRASTNGAGFTNASFAMGLRRRQTGDFDAA